MFYLITILIIALLFVKSKKSLHMLQQNLYNVLFSERFSMFPLQTALPNLLLP